MGASAPPQAGAAAAAAAPAPAGQYATPYQASVLRLQTTISSLQLKIARRGNVSGDELDLLHRQFEVMINHHPTYSPAARRAAALAAATEARVQAKVAAAAQKDPAANRAERGPAAGKASASGGARGQRRGQQPSAAQIAAAVQEHQQRLQQQHEQQQQQQQQQQAPAPLAAVEHGYSPAPAEYEQQRYHSQTVEEASPFVHTLAERQQRLAQMRLAAQQAQLEYYTDQYQQYSDAGFPLPSPSFGPYGSQISSQTAPPQQLAEGEPHAGAWGGEDAYAQAAAAAQGAAAVDPGAGALELLRLLTMVHAQGSASLEEIVAALAVEAAGAHEAPPAGDAE